MAMLLLEQLIASNFDWRVGHAKTKYLLRKDARKGIPTSS